MLAAGFLVLLVGGLVVASQIFDDDATRDDDTGEITDEGDLSAFSLEVGDCLNDLTDGVVLDVPAVPCADPHEGEVFALYDLDEGLYPGEEAIATDAETQCPERLASYAPAAAEDDNITFFYLYPTAESWATGDREIACVATFLDGPRPGRLQEAG